jgi:Uma2 family endonuclease
VSLSSLRRDRIVKQRIYAQADVADYWIVDLRHDVVIVHRDPSDDGYRTVTHHDDGVLSPLHHPTVQLDVRALLR